MKVLFGKNRVLLVVAILLLPLLCLPSIRIRYQVKAASTGLVEDFTSTTYRDGSATNVSGWGDGLLELPHMTVALVGLLDYGADEPFVNFRSVEVRGNFAYITDGWGYLHVINITDIRNPEIIDSLRTLISSIHDVAVSGDYAYLSCGLNGLHIFDVSDPQYLSAVGTPYPVCSLKAEVNGNYVYYLNASGLGVANITDPIHPSFVGFCDINTDGCKDLYIVGNLAYIADWYNEVHVVNITDLTNPTLIGTCIVPSNVQKLCVAGNYVYTTDYFGQICVVDVTNPTNPTLAGGNDCGSGIMAICAEGNYAYTVGSRLMVINITIPSQPARACIETDSHKSFTDMKISGNYIFAASIEGLFVYEISEPKPPILTCDYDAPVSVTGLDVENDFVYIAGAAPGLEVHNITDLSSPSLAGSYETIGEAWDVDVEGNYAYVADGSSGLEVINITDPTNPTWAGSYLTDDFAYGVFVEGDYAYVAASGAGLVVVNVTDPTNPMFAGAYSTPGSSSYGVFVEGNYAYVADWSSGVYILDVTDPTNPIVTSTYDTPGAASDVYVDGNTLFVADWDAGLLIFDITNPATPNLVGSYDTPAEAWSVWIDGNVAYVADGGSGLQVINITVLSAPSYISSHNTPGVAYAVQVHGKHAFIADDTSVQIIEVSRYIWEKYEALAIAQSVAVFNANSSFIIGATVTSSASASPPTSISYYLSANDGNNWEPVTLGTYYTFVDIGHILKWRIFPSTADPIFTPSLESLIIDLTTALPAPNLYSPSDGENTTESQPSFCWAPVDGAVRYRLQLDQSFSFDSSSLIEVDVVATDGIVEYNLTTPLSAGTWFWRVVAIDSDGDEGLYSARRTLDVEAEIITTPLPPTILDFPLEAIVLGLTITVILSIIIFRLRQKRKAR
jgi:hypothetical protein